MKVAGNSICAIILAAGLSTRMGQPKMLLPWGDHTVIEQVAITILEAGIVNPIVVTGAEAEKVGALLEKYPVTCVFNPRYRNGEMLHSFQTGIAALDPACQATLMVLGDQPQIQPATVAAILSDYQAVQAPLIIPSYRMRRGHPWIVRRALWQNILAIQPPATLHDFLLAHAGDIHYVNLETPTILADLDTPDDYQKNRPGVRTS